jgi:S-adenosylmethionine/arginine decarboxylase-like enzyme
MVWGFHLLIDLKGLNVDEDLLNNEYYLNLFLTEIVEVADMKLWGAPTFKRLTECEPHLSGTTIIAPIHTSSIVIHICDKTKEAYIDIFSCKNFTRENIINIVDKYLRPSVRTFKFLHRG